MCGIVGYFGQDMREEEALDLLRRMCATLVHRGPDDGGYYTNGPVGLGMRRLSIIDLKSGHQPMVSSSGVAIVFNGEIYNYRDLRADLVKRGCVFATESDTEVILRQYEQDGPACVSKFNGMFAFAIWDQPRRTLFLARDRMGVKPLYYYWDGRTFLFASEVKALLATGQVPRKMNRQALWDYLTFRYVPQPESIWQNVFKLLPAHTLTLTADKIEPVAVRYWDIPYADQPVERGDSELDREFTGLFLDAVRRRLIADVPVGVLLSGGLDSSAVAAAIAEVHEPGLASFSVAFEDSPAIDELPYARRVARCFGTDHHEVVIGAKDAQSFLPQMVKYSDEPLADLASIPMYYVSRLAGERVKVVLSGEGSDEILAGYDFDRVQSEVERRSAWQNLPSWLKRGRGLSLLRRWFGDKMEHRYSMSASPVDLRYAANPPHMTNYFSSEEKGRLLTSPFAGRDSMDVVRADIQRAVSREPLHQMLYSYCQSWLVEDLLMKADRMSMANSLELRTPFLDYRLVEWAARAPVRVKVARRDGSYETKHVLRQFARKRLPAEIISRPKMGFPVPLYEWLAGPMKNWAEDLLMPQDAYSARWFVRQQVEEITRRGTMLDAAKGDQHRLWLLLIFELWCQEWKPE